MISTAAEFVALRQSNDLQNQHRATHEEANIEVWLEVIEQYPDFKEWVIRNKTIPIEILEKLCKDENVKIRITIAQKRKINNVIFEVLSIDPEVKVRYALICNLALNSLQMLKINVADSEWLQNQLSERIKQFNKI
jgi:hypothetical protein